MADVIGFIISAKNEASKVLREVNKDIAALEKGNKNASGLEKFATGLTAVAAAGAGVVVLKEAIEATAELSKAGANFERLNASFNSLASSYGTSGDAILSAVDAVTQGTLSQQTIMQQANNAMLLGVADTADEFSTLAKIAQERGRAMGISMEFAFESIVKGVGRLSPLILDNLGIVINADQTYAKFAATLGVAADQLTEAQKRQALLNALKAEVADWDSTKVLDGAAAWEKLGVSIENAKVKLGLFINSNSEVIEGINGFANAVNFAALSLGTSVGDQAEYARQRIQVLTEQIAFYEKGIEEMKNGTDIGSMWQRAIGEVEVETQNVAALKAELAAVQAQAGMLNQNLLETSRAMVLLGGSSMNAAQQAAWMEAQLAVVSDQTERYAKAAGVSKDAALGWAQSIIEGAGSAQAAIPLINQLVAEMEAAAARLSAIQGLINGAIGSLGSIGAEAYRNSGYNPEVLTMISDAETAVRGVEQSLVDSGYQGAQLQAVMGQFTDQAFAGLNTINEMSTAINKASGGGGGGGGVKQLTEEFRNLQGIVSGLFDGAFSDVGANVADFLPREDAINEPARRIASVMVEGFDSEWVDYFKNSFPILWQEYMGRSGGDVKNAAALLLKDFQNGMRPELIDKEKMKEIAKRMFFVDQQTKAMIDEVAKELAGELGISIEEAKGYAGGASGGGGGLVKKFVNPEEIKKIKDMLSFAPKWDWGAGGGGGNPLIESGKKAGILGDDGKLLIKVKVELDEVGLSAITSKTVNQTAKITTIDFDKAGLEKYIADTFGPIGLTAKLFLLDTGLDSLKASLVNTSINVSAVPVLNYTDWETYKTDAIAMLNGITFMPKLSSEDEAAMQGSVSLFKQAVASAITDQAYVSSISSTFQTAFSTAIAEQNLNYRMLGLIVGTYMYSGFSEYNLGLILASELSRQLTEAKATFEASAGSAGKMWGTAFLKTVSENVPFELLMILTDLVTPEVIKKVKDANSRGSSEQ